MKAHGTARGHWLHGTGTARSGFRYVTDAGSRVTNKRVLGDFGLRVPPAYTDVQIAVVRGPRFKPGDSTHVVADNIGITSWLSSGANYASTTASCTLLVTCQTSERLSLGISIAPGLRSEKSRRGSCD